MLSLLALQVAPVVMHSIEDIAYKLSLKFSPPKYDIRHGRIADDWGGIKNAIIHICHEKPEDVKVEEMTYYGDAMSFMNPKEILFYLYYIVKSLSTKDEHPLDEVLSSINDNLNDYLVLVGDYSNLFRDVISYLYINFFEDTDNIGIYEFNKISDYIEVNA